jgi:hypothetical protein
MTTFVAIYTGNRGEERPDGRFEPLPCRRVDWEVLR